MRHILFDKLRIHTFKVHKHYDLISIGMVTHVSGGIRVLCPPLLCGHAEQRHIQQVGFIGIREVGLLPRQVLRQQIFLDRVRMDAVVHLGQFAFGILLQGQPVPFIRFEALVVLDDIQLELWRNSRSKLHCYVHMGKRAAIPAGFGLDTCGSGSFNPFLRGQHKRIASRRHSKVVEFDHVKIRIVKLLP